VQIGSNRRYASPPNRRGIAYLPGQTGHLRQFVEQYGVICAPLTDILRNKAFASKRARKCPIPWGEAADEAFNSIRSALASPTYFKKFKPK
ncbi:unnamed protein product, partial [Pylaiella littoralis]